MTGERIKKLRKEKGLTQEQLGNLLGVKKSAIAKYENNRVSNLKKDTIQTQNLNLRPDYSYDKNKRTLTGYTMVNTITVKTNKLDAVPKLIDTAIANKATNVNELRYYVENESDSVGRLTQEAVAKAKIIAKLTADSMDTKLKGIKTINIVKNAPSDNMGGVMYAAKAQNAASTPVEPGKVKLQVNVYAQFYVK